MSLFSGLANAPPVQGLTLFGHQVAAVSKPMDTASLWNEPEYSDVTINFSGRSIACHKVVLCRASAYFKTLCGLGSQFAERNLRAVELKDDDPDALEAILLHLYQRDYDPGVKKSWRFYLNLKLAANKYLLPDLSCTANLRFQKAATSITDMAELVKIFRALDNEFDHDDGMVKYRHRLCKARLEDLMQCPEYRAFLNENTDLLWHDLDELRQRLAAVKKVQADSEKVLDERTVQLCVNHRCALDAGKHTSNLYGYSVPGCAFSSCGNNGFVAGPTSETKYYLARGPSQPA